MSAARTALRAVALAGPFALAFASGGFPEQARQVALVAAAALLAAWALLAADPLPRGRAAWLALGGLAGLTAWIAFSAGWAPRADVARADLERTALYLVALLLGATLWRPGRAAARAVEPAVALGIALVVGYGLLGRLAPGVLELDSGVLAGARLSEPLTYWNAEGALAAMGLLLCARLLGDPERPRAVRMLGAAAAVPVGAALYLTFSRGALAALAAGVLVLLVVAPTWAQLRAAVIALEAAVAAAITSAALPGVNDLRGDVERDGALGLVVLAVLALAAAALAAWQTRAEDEDSVRRGRLPLPRWTAAVALVLAVALVAGPVAVGGGDGTGSAPAFGETTSRLSSAGSNRYEYWRVALRVGADAPVRGAGSGSFGTEWLARRPIDDVVRDAHSLPLETFAELGLVGLALLAALLAGIVLAARACLRRDPALAAGPVAALAAFGLHSSIDWDWEIPALTLVAVLLAGLLLSRAAPPPAPRSGG